MPANMQAVDPWQVVSQTPVDTSQAPPPDQTGNDPWQVVSQTPVKPEPKSVGGFLSNVVSSGGNLVKNAATIGAGALEMPMRPLVSWALQKDIPAKPEEQQAQGVLDTVAGLTHQGFKKVGLGSAADETPEAQADIAKAQAVEDQYKQRYGGLKNIRETLYSDPVGVLADAAMLTGGAAGAAGKTAELADAANLGRTATALRTVGRGAQVATRYNPIVAVPENAPSAVRAAGKVIGNWRDHVADPHITMMQALRPTASRTGWEKSIATAMPDIKAAESVTGPVTDVNSLLDAVAQAKRTKRAQIQMYTTPAQQAKLTVDLNPVADAMERAAKNTLELPENMDAAGNPIGGYKAALDEAQTYRQTVPIEVAEDYLQKTNAALDAYYAKYPGVRRAALRANPETAALVGKADALRDVFYQGLDNPSAGSVPRDINRRYGALIDVEDAALRRKNVAARQAPQNLVEQIGNLATAKQVVGAGLKTVRGDILGAAGDLAEGAAVRSAAKWMKEHQDTNNLIRRAFKNYSVPAKRFHGPATGPIAGLYGALPAATSQIGVSGVTVPNMAGQIRTGTNQMVIGPKQLPAAGPNIGVSGTVVPDIIGRSSRGQGTGLPLLEGVQGKPPVAPGLIWDEASHTWKQPPLPPPPEPKIQPAGVSGASQPPSQGAGRFRSKMKPSEVSGPGAKTVGAKRPYAMPPATPPKNPYR